jgi:hypothetical protein
MENLDVIALRIELHKHHQIPDRDCRIENWVKSGITWRKLGKDLVPLIVAAAVYGSIDLVEQG